MHHLLSRFTLTDWTRFVTTNALVGTIIWSFVHMVENGLPKGHDAPLLLTVLGWIISEASAALKYGNGTTESSKAKTVAMVDMAARQPPPAPNTPPPAARPFPPPDLDIPPAPPAA